MSIIYSFKLSIVFSLTKSILVNVLYLTFPHFNFLSLFLIFLADIEYASHHILENFKAASYEQKKSLSFLPVNLIDLSLFRSYKLSHLLQPFQAPCHRFCSTQKILKLLPAILSFFFIQNNGVCRQFLLPSRDAAPYKFLCVS